MTTPVFFSGRASGVLSVPMPNASGVCAYRASYAVPTTQATGDLIDLAVIPPGCRIVDMILDCDQLDSSTGLVVDVGILAGNPGDSTLADGVTSRSLNSSAFFSAITAPVRAGGVARPTIAGAYRDVAVSDVYRSIGVAWTTQATTAVAGNIGLTIFYHAADVPT